MNDIDLLEKEIQDLDLIIRDLEGSDDQIWGAIHEIQIRLDKLEENNNNAA